MSYLGLGSEEGVADVAHPPGGVSVITGTVDVDVAVILKRDTKSCPWSVRDTGNEPRLFGKLGTPEGLKMGLGFGEQPTNGQPTANQRTINQ